MRGKAGNSSLQLLDDVCETPELIWTSEMQSELRTAIIKLLTSVEPKDRFKLPIELTADYRVIYRQLESEVFVGGVYIRLYLKQPTFRLSNAVFFLEKVLEHWEAAFETQVPLVRSKNSDAGDSRALVLGKEDYLSLMTSCIVCCVKGEPAVVDHVLAWGFLSKLVLLLKRSIDSEKRGTPVVGICRLLLQFTTRSVCVEALGSCNNDIILELTRALDVDSMLSKPSYQSSSICQLSKDASLIVELLKRIFLNTGAICIADFVSMACRAQLPLFLLNHVVDAPASVLETVRNPNTLKLNAIDVLKAMASIESVSSAVIQAMLNGHHSWTEYRNQSHDLFITVNPK